MGQFAYDFSLMLLHSLWQSALLLLLYKTSTLFIKGQQPYYRRNLLFFILLIQLCTSSVTFIIYASDVQSLQPALLQISSLATEGSILRNAVPLLFSLYLFIIAYKTTVLFYHWHSFKSKCNTSLTKASIDHQLFAINKAGDLGIQRKVQLWYSNAINSPITFGFFKPVILLPVALMTKLSVRETEMLILHELIHIKNSDYLLNFILIVSETLFFFNPFIKNICALIKLEREKNCDVEVIQSAYSSLTYAEALLKIARFKSGINSLHLAAASDNKQLLDRVVFFTSENNLRFTKSRYVFVTYLFIAGIFILNLFTIKQLSRKAGTSGYEYTASSMPGYNAYSFTSSFNDADNVQVVTAEVPTESEINTGNKTVESKNIIFDEDENDYTVTNPLEAQEVVDLDDDQFIPVSNVTPLESKEFILNEENSAGNKVTKAYKMILVNGKWIVQPLWMYSESKLRSDSMVATVDSIPRAFHIIQ